jgi:hypothetical protein
MYRGIATFTLDYGRCPRWLFERMVKLGREMTRVIVAEYGPEEFIKRIADPVWFQSLGTVLAFDWNASGLTTILTAALKEAIRGEAKDLGIFICGGKGKTSRKTPEEIQNWGGVLSLPEAQVNDLVYHSKMAAKVDSALVQDGFQIYHHSFFFSRSGAWTVVQQGMNITDQTARRYHWFSENIKDLVCEPHSGIISDVKKPTLNLVAEESAKVRALNTELIGGGYYSLMKDIQLLRKHSSALHKMIALKFKGQKLTLLNLENTEFKHHQVEFEDFSKSRYLEKILWKLCGEKPENYEKILAMAGVGPKTMRALALVSEVIYGAEPSYEDPARYSFAHGGKDATPYLIDRQTYDWTIETMKQLVEKMKIDFSEKWRIQAKLEGN